MCKINKLCASIIEHHLIQQYTGRKYGDIYISLSNNLSNTGNEEFI